jgi:hypothetical protein
MTAARNAMAAAMLLAIVGAAAPATGRSGLSTTDAPWNPEHINLGFTS